MALRRPHLRSHPIVFLVLGAALTIFVVQILDVPGRNQKGKEDAAMHKNLPATWRRATEQTSDMDCGRPGKLECRVDVEDLGARPSNFRRWRSNQTVSVTEIMRGSFFRMERHTVNVGGKQIDDWLWLEVPDMVNCMVEDEDGKFLMYRQEKYGFKGDSLAPVGGYLNAGESGLDGCKREVLEEMGMECSSFRQLGTYRTDTNRG
mmetsp:Transcript_30480/g.59547  ORF Transcript_30480/g.59547 Transcript_30480/m.59547 type:complete len:205 (-) Transcript_30480:62-676(-)|eukprot:CAMPEP_0173382716 /NCGR_PEP_ID=MMETSP1356-20130122/5253_1 /TAXON_ID=77927 ORGANISM="Hemiselmis virescens, Strain PCC157" /NCGR_SAMPLE_ID=MMETSP1356 /ASSEMBLY_ACC=CAM_ASM_000847 /LENGTH=204 /DNA_ID=CAMNT_0014337225 /DNA_START=174 /DNA_END=788 /DNA_ORIENTATION=+